MAPSEWHTQWVWVWVFSDCFNRKVKGEVPSVAGFTEIFPTSQLSEKKNPFTLNLIVSL